MRYLGEIFGWREWVVAKNLWEMANELKEYGDGKGEEIKAAVDVVLKKVESVYERVVGEDYIQKKYLGEKFKETLKGCEPTDFRSLEYPNLSQSE
jgi:hypothetical protein